jgi:acyl-coenzyme A thioesterase PaaI-like protein
VKNLVMNAANFIPEKFKDQFFINAWSFFNVPMLFWLRPKIVDFKKDKTIISIPLNNRSKNHLNSMYFGALAAGADCAGGILAMKLIKESGEDVSLAFKDFRASFLKRAEGDTHFICDEASEIREFIQEVLKSDKRLNKVVGVYAVCPTVSGDEPVAKFELTLSLKKK